ncbi:VOC family protein [Flavobacterium endoglycinae]|uniref:VOC family protein n=1 Tax=Flavobacterium endoglycinae TaxID=2816357 RepID=A0ABX7QBS8_9FLAO|nr:VOC family protein [Flavobacterium endoglycinae]QSW88407.1 VOC family protein [Flavobacterium endoglycinae]
MIKIKTTIKPFLTVSDAVIAVDFYTNAFGAVESKRFSLPDNKISSVITIEDAEFYLSDEEPCDGTASAGQISNAPIRIILETSNADELFENALKLGAEEICPLTTEEDWKIGKLKDPFGHIWEIGHPI